MAAVKKLHSVFVILGEIKQLVGTFKCEIPVVFYE